MARHFKTIGLIGKHGDGSTSGIRMMMAVAVACRLWLGLLALLLSGRSRAGGALGLTLFLELAFAKHAARQLKLASETDAMAWLGPCFL